MTKLPSSEKVLKVLLNGTSRRLAPAGKNEKGLGVQPSMGEIFVAQGKRRRSVALGKNEQKETVRTKMIFRELTFFRTELKSRSEM